MGPKVKGFQIGERVCADNSELCGECFYCRRGQELLCENFEAHGVTMNGGFAEYCAYPGVPCSLVIEVNSTDDLQPAVSSTSRTCPTSMPPCSSLRRALPTDSTR